MKHWQIAFLLSLSPSLHRANLRRKAANAPQKSGANDSTRRSKNCGRRASSCSA